MAKESILGIVPDAGDAKEAGAASKCAGGGQESSVAMEGQATNDDGLGASKLESQKVCGDVVRVTVGAGASQDRRGGKGHGVWEE